MVSLFDDGKGGSESRPFSRKYIYNLMNLESV